MFDPEPAKPCGRLLQNETLCLAALGRGSGLLTFVVPSSSLCMSSDEILRSVGEESDNSDGYSSQFSKLSGDNKQASPLRAGKRETRPHGSDLPLAGA